MEAIMRFLDYELRVVSRAWRNSVKEFSWSAAVWLVLSFAIGSVIHWFFFGWPAVVEEWPAFLSYGVGATAVGGFLFFNLKLAEAPSQMERELVAQIEAFTARAHTPPGVPYEVWAHQGMIDLPTAAAYWSGSLDVGNAYRHACFRNLKNAIDAGLLGAETQGAKANRFARVSADNLIDFIRNWEGTRAKLLTVTQEGVVLDAGTSAT